MEIKTFLTIEDIESVIVSEDYSYPRDGITICTLNLKNGTNVIGINYGSINPAGQNWEIGKKESRSMALEKVWELEGYLLRQKLLESGGVLTKNLEMSN